MTALDERDLDLLEKILGRLGSDFDGERATAAAMAWRFLRERKLTWGDVLRPVPASHGALPTPAVGWRQLSVRCLDIDDRAKTLSGWERKFLLSIRARFTPPTPKQRAVLDRIALSLGAAP